MDFTLIILAVVSFAAFAALEYFICSKAKNPSTEKLMFFVPFLIFVGALVVYGSDANGSFLDLRGMVTVVITIYGVLSLVAILAGYYLYHLKHLPQDADNCPFSEK
ncbi:MAG: hypothetical protein IJN77_06755 [Oscillospiraceae bacterium]|nr:hypothetical protein [Oscillospiraceae bacterium]